MLFQRHHKQQQNCLEVPKTGQSLKSNNVLHNTIEMLKKQKTNLQISFEQKQKKSDEQKRKLRVQIETLKQRIKQLSEQNIIQSILQTKDEKSTKNDLEMKNRMQEMEIEYLKKSLSEKDKSIEKYRSEVRDLEEKTKLYKEEKQKNMEISLMEKINLEEKLKIIQSQTQSKKGIICNLNYQLERITKKDCEVRMKEREMIKRGKDMQKYQQEFQSYYDKNEKKFKAQIQNLEKQNQFLKKQIKKILKKVKVSCECQSQTDQWKDKLFRMGKQLARARVEICKMTTTNQNYEKKCEKKKNKKIRNMREEESSIQSLSLSEDSEGEYYETKKK